MSDFEDKISDAMDGQSWSRLTGGSFRGQSVLLRRKTMCFEKVADGIAFDGFKSIIPGAIVTNHVWPHFNPDEYIGAKYKLDYCTQTITWFYPPSGDSPVLKWKPQK